MINSPKCSTTVGFDIGRGFDSEHEHRTCNLALGGVSDSMTCFSDGRAYTNSQQAYKAYANKWDNERMQTAELCRVSRPGTFIAIMMSIIRKFECASISLSSPYLSNAILSGLWLPYFIYDSNHSSMVPRNMFGSETCLFFLFER